MEQFGDVSFSKAKTTPTCWHWLIGQEHYPFLTLMLYRLVYSFIYVSTFHIFHFETDPEWSKPYVWSAFHVSIRKHSRQFLYSRWRVQQKSAFVHTGRILPWYNCNTKQLGLGLQDTSKQNGHWLSGWQLISSRAFPDDCTFTLQGSLCLQRCKLYWYTYSTFAYRGKRFAFLIILNDL